MSKRHGAEIRTEVRRLGHKHNAARVVWGPTDALRIFSVAPGTRLQQNYPSRFRGLRRRLRGGRRAGRVGTFGSRRSLTSHGSAGHKDQPLQLCKAKVHDCLCRVSFYGIFSKNPRISGVDDCYRCYKGTTTGGAAGICRQHNGTKNGRVNAETPAKKKPRLA